MDARTSSPTHREAAVISYVLRPAQPGDAPILTDIGARLTPTGLTEKDLFVYPASETWLAEHGGRPVAAMRLCWSEHSAQALLTDLAGDPEALFPLAHHLLRVAAGREATSVEAAAPRGSAPHAVLLKVGMRPFRRVVELRWQLPATRAGDPPQGYAFAEEVPDPDLYARLATVAYRGSWDWLFARWGGDVAARRNFARLLESPRGETFIAARCEGRLAGFVSYGGGEVVLGDWSTFGVLVHPDDRGRGVGRHLLLLALERLWGIGQRDVHMHTTAPVDSDPPAVRLYLASGAALRGDTMVLRLPEA